MNLVAPFAVAHDRLRELRGHLQNRARSGGSADRRRRDRAIGAVPVAASTKLSLVEVSPSIVAQLNETAAISRVAVASRPARCGASVATKASIVAMSGGSCRSPSRCR
jgi:hypothetical protein